MNITLRPETQQLLENQIKSGLYASADDVLYAALNALATIESNSLDDATLDAIDCAEDEIERGEVVDWNDVRDDVRSKFLRG